nr:MAG TPA: hypothetical protein [Caudoviricetes sp.]
MFTSPTPIHSLPFKNIQVPLKRRSCIQVNLSSHPDF